MHQRAAGFLLVELLLAVAIGIVLVGQIAQSTLLDTGQARRLGRLLRERVATQRTLELMRAELQDALEVSPVMLEEADSSASGAKRTVLELRTSAGLITYSLEPKPDSIWQGQALMRCGPSYGLWGNLKQSSSSCISRVLLDGLAGHGITARRPDAARVLEVRIQRDFKEHGEVVQQLNFTLTMPAPGLPPLN